MDIQRHYVWERAPVPYLLSFGAFLVAQMVNSESRSVVSDSLWLRGLYSPWNSPGQNTGVGSLSLLQEIFPTQGSNPGLPHCRRILYQLSHKGRNLLTIQKTRVWSLGQEYPLEKGTATHSSILAWRVPSTEEPGGLQSMERQRVRQDWMTNTFTFRSETGMALILHQSRALVELLKTFPRKGLAFEDDLANNELITRWPEILPPWWLHPELLSSKTLLSSSNVYLFFCPSWLSSQACFSIFCVILTTVRVLMDSSFIKKSSLTFVHQGNVLHLLLKCESDSPFLSHKIDEFILVGKDISQEDSG